MWRLFLGNSALFSFRLYPSLLFFCISFSFICLLPGVFNHQAGETALHSVAGVLQGTKAANEDLVKIVRILLEHGANLTLATYQVILIPFSC